ncbi:MAG TPA: hypothetical protein VFY25_16275 [Anaerolineales bacterium]|nr:hypothetical protein [Anaerolineales bacterium]
MNTKHLLIASLAGGLVSLMLVNTPFVNLINVLLCAGYWIGPLVAVWLYRRLGGTLTMSQAIVTGMLAGAWHGLFGVILSPLGLAGAGGVLNAVRPFMSAQDLPDLETALTGVGGVLFNLVGIAFDIGFGFLGGLIGNAVFRSARPADPTGVRI